VNYITFLPKVKGKEDTMANFPERLKENIRKLS